MKNLSFLFCLICAATITAYAQSGTTGSLTWSISGGTLTISGNGAMPNYSYSAPWATYTGYIVSVVIHNQMRPLLILRLTDVIHKYTFVY